MSQAKRIVRVHQPARRVRGSCIGVQQGLLLQGEDVDCVRLKAPNSKPWYRHVVGSKPGGIAVYMPKMPKCPAAAVVRHDCRVLNCRTKGALV